MAANQSRYLGVQPFKTSDRHLFFGRDEDIENLHDFIVLEKLIVLFGKSGYGKSSLLSAGIVPKLTDPAQPDAFRFRPVEVRLGTFQAGQSFSPVETTLRVLQNVPTAADTDFLKKFTDGDSLWLYFKQRQTATDGQFVLIFDQFEEFFSYPAEQQEVFRRQLAELLYSDIPQSVRARLDELTDSERQKVVKPMKVKAVFAIRSDRLSFLDSMKDVLPAILHKRYELRPLTSAQASDAIVRPARAAGGQFSSPPFEYTAAGLAAILEALTSGTSNNQSTDTHPGIEAFQLQILCEHLETLVRNGQVPDRDGNGLPDITPDELPEMSNLYENYYRRKLAELAPDQQRPAQLVLEDGLLAEDAATGEARRVSVDSRALIGQFTGIGLTDGLLADLEKTYLLRREMNTVGGFSFEISHDTLVAPIQKAKAERKIEETRERLEREQAEKERQLLEAQRQADEEKRRAAEAEQLKNEAIVARKLAEDEKRKAQKMMFLAIGLAGLASLATLGAGYLYDQSEEKNIVIQKTLDDLKSENEKRLAAEAAKRTNEFDKEIALAYGQLSGGNSCLGDETFGRLQTAVFELNSEETKKKIQDLNQAIQKNNADCPIFKTQK